MASVSRRDVIKGAGATAAIGGPAVTAPADAQIAGKGLDAFEHVVVLMLENRSFDNLLGHLYAPGSVPRGQSFEGVIGKNLSNPIPPDAHGAERKVVPVWPGTVMDNPNPDPGEEYPHVSTQLYRVVDPQSNAHKAATKMAAPFNTPSPVPAVAPMDGFVTDYINNYVRTKLHAPSYDEYKVIMQCYEPDSVPVISALARSFAVCDHWFCAVPSQTFTNRSFFHAATSGGAVINEPYSHWVHGNDGETIFERITAKGLSWRVHFDNEDVFPLTALIHYPRLQPFVPSNFSPMQDFFDAARDGTLPHYTFIEPRLFIQHNDMHPPISVMGKTQHSSILPGEKLIHDIYEAIRLSDSPTGSNFQNTLFVIIFDEHGGCYDHVPPPPAVPPDPSKAAGQFGFNFDRLGIRVPAILVSAYIEAGTVINTQFSHGSMIRTLSDKWQLGHLTERDRTATNLSEAFNRPEPRERADWPVTTPRPTPPADIGHDRPLNALQRDVVELGNAVAGDPIHKPGEVLTVFEAIRRMHKALDRQERAVKKRN